MNAADVISLYTDLQKLSINIWVDGGWGVDALLGEQTRPHKDLDIAIQQRDIPRLRAFLEALAGAAFTVFFGAVFDATFAAGSPPFADFALFPTVCSACCVSPK